MSGSSSGYGSAEKAHSLDDEERQEPLAIPDQSRSYKAGWIAGIVAMVIFAAAFFSGRFKDINSTSALKMAAKIKDNYYYTFYFGNGGKITILQPTASPTFNQAVPVSSPVSSPASFPSPYSVSPPSSGAFSTTEPSAAVTSPPGSGAAITVSGQNVAGQDSPFVLFFGVAQQNSIPIGSTWSCDKCAVKYGTVVDKTITVYGSNVNLYLVDGSGNPVTPDSGYYYSFNFNPEPSADPTGAPVDLTSTVWILGSVIGQSCDATCSSLGGTCDQVTFTSAPLSSKSSFESIIASSYRQSSTSVCPAVGNICSAVKALGFGGRAPFWNGASTNPDAATCYYNEDTYAYTGSDYCSYGTYNDSYKFCPCMGITTCSTSG